MSEDQYIKLLEFLEKRFNNIDRRFDQIENNIDTLCDNLKKNINFSRPEDAKGKL